MSDETAGSGAAALNPKKAFRDLRPRIISGITMLAATLTLLYAGTVPFAILVLGLALVMCWEWGRVVRGDGLDASLIVHGSAVALAVLLSLLGWYWAAILAVFAGAVIMVPLGNGRDLGLSAFGVHYVGLPAIALIWFRDGDLGALAVLYIFVLVWAADIAAFTGGRLIGGYKLWPSVSPNKTWAGFVSGVAASIVASLAFAGFVSGAPLAYAAAIGLATGLLSQGGDLAESALKRGHGVKDSSDLIPGHGGVMDRMDGVVTVACAAGILALLINAQAPAHALLFGA